jgi:hypothetical protein
MGYYTKLSIKVVLTKNAPIDILTKLCNDEMWKELATAKWGKYELAYTVSDSPKLPIEHPFGQSTRWSQIFNNVTSKLNIEDNTLKVKCDIKAYESIYEQLIDWLTPYIESGVIKTKGEDENKWTLDLYK